MENFKFFPHLNAIFTTALIFIVISVNGQISTPCTNSMISTFTPCLNFITGSTGNGASPTATCCDSLRSLTSTGLDCACLIITGNVPFSLPINRTLAISLPRACKTSVPVQCKASGVPLPAPGPALFGPTPPPTTAASPFSPTASKALASAPASPPTETTSDITPEASPPASDRVDPTATPGSRPVLTPTSASNPSYISSPSLLLAAFLGLMILNYH